MSMLKYNQGEHEGSELRFESIELVMGMHEHLQVCLAGASASLSG
jgi:hypothetical protein